MKGVNAIGQETSMPLRPHDVLTVSLIALACACACNRDQSAPTLDVAPLAAISPRDWSAHPAIVEIDDSREVYALSDPHGGYLALGNLLSGNHLIDSFASDPSRASDARWTGKDAILVVAGDLIDKGPESLGVIDLLRTLEREAPSSGGRVVVTMGNHEAEFFVDPHNHKAASSSPDLPGIDEELTRQGVSPADLARGNDAAGRGRWLLDLPFAVRIKQWFFSHGGNTDGLSLKDLDKRLRKSIDSSGFGDKDITGDKSILEAQEWYGDPNADSIGAHNAAALGVKHIVFGHDPGAFKEHGHILSNHDGSLIKLDVAMGLSVAGAVTSGLMLHVTTKGQDAAEVLDVHGARQPLAL